MRLGKLAGLARTMPNPQLFVQPFIRREAWLSSRIEGTQADIGDLYTYEAAQLSPSGDKSTPPNSDVRELSNYVRALQYGLQRLNALPVSRRLICELHERLMHGVRGGAAYPGQFRYTQNWIGGSTISNATFVPPRRLMLLSGPDTCRTCRLSGDSTWQRLMRQRDW